MPVRFEADVRGRGPLCFEEERPAGAARGVAGAPRRLDDYSAGAEIEQALRAQRRELEADFGIRLGQARQEAAQVLADLGERVRIEREGTQEELATHATQLALAIAERLVRDRIDRDPAVVERVLREAVAGLEEASDLQVRAHPVDAAHLRGLGEELAVLGIAEIVDDPRQRRGGCEIRRDERVWDATLVGQVRALQEAIEKALGAAS